MRTCHSLEGHTRGKGDYFHIRGFFFFLQMKDQCENCAGTHIDDAGVMLDKNLELVKKVKDSGNQAWKITQSI